MGSRRTYIPTLNKLLKKICAFITVHRTRILEVIGTENETLLNNLLTACNALTAILDLIDVVVD